MKKQTKNWIYLLVILFLMVNIPENVKASPEVYETSSRTKLFLTQETNNYELLGQLGTIETISTYPNPQFDSTDLTHDLTRININNLQKYDVISTDYNETELTDGENVFYGTVLPEYDTSAPFDSIITMNATYNCSEYISYANKMTAGGSGDLASMEEDDLTGNQYTAPVGTFFTPTTLTKLGSCNSESGNIASLQYNDANYYTQAYTVYGTYVSVKIGVNYDGIDDNAEYKIICEYKHNDGADGCRMVIFDNRDVQISSESITDIGWHTITRYVTSAYGIGLITFEAWDSYSSSTAMQLDVLTIQQKTNSTVEATLEYETNNCANTTAYVEVQFNPFISTEAISTVRLNGDSYPFTPNVYNTFNLYVEKSDSFSLDIDVISTNTYNRALLTIDYIWFYIGFIPTNESDIILQDFQYEINEVPIVENVTLYFQSSIGVQTNSTLIYRLDSSQFIMYDHISDLHIPEQILEFNITTLFDINLSYIIEYSYNEWIVPSEIDMRLNNDPVIDETYNSGYVSNANYNTTLCFTALLPNIIFNFTIESQFRYTFDLDIISSTYFRKTLLLSDYHSLLLTQCDFLFNANIKHSYFNNIDMGNQSSVYPLYALTKGSSLKIEVIIADEAYLELDPIAMAQAESILNVLSLSNILLFNSLSGTSSVFFELPMSMTANAIYMEIDNIQYIENYIHSENSSYSVNAETQTPTTPYDTTTTNKAEYTHVENSSYQTYLEDQTVIDSVVSTTSNGLNYGNFTVYATNSSECESFDIEPYGIYENPTDYSQTLQLHNNKRYSDYTAINLTLSNTTDSWNITMDSTYQANNTFEESDWNRFTHTDYSTYTMEPVLSLHQEDTIHKNWLNYTGSGSSTTAMNVSLGFDSSFSFFIKDISAETFDIYFFFFDHSNNRRYCLNLDEDQLVLQDLLIDASSNTTSQDAFVYSEISYFELLFNSDSIQLFYNGNLTLTLPIFHTINEITYMRICSEQTNQFYIDNIDFTGSTGFYRYRNSRDIFVSSPSFDFGHFQGTFSFDLDEVNRPTADFVSDDISKGVGVVSNELYGHKKVLTCYSSDSSQIMNQFLDQQTGTIEFYLLFPQTDKTISVLLREGTGLGIYLVFDSSGQLKINGAGSSYQTISSNTWYHYRLIFDCLTDKFDLFIDGVQAIDDGSFMVPRTNINYFGICVEGSERNVSIDAIDYSWSTDYVLNRNMQLNVSQDITNLNWYAFPNWESGYRLCTKDASAYTNNFINGYNIDPTSEGEIINIVNITTTNAAGNIAYATEASQTIECLYISNRTDYGTYIHLKYGSTTKYTIHLASGKINSRIDYSNELELCDYYADTEYYFKFTRKDNNEFYTWINGVSYGALPSWNSGTTASINGIAMQIGNAQPFEIEFGLISASGNSNYFSEMNRLENSLTSPLPVEFDIPDMLFIQNLLDTGSYYYYLTVYNETDSFNSDIITIYNLADFNQSPLLDVGYPTITQCGCTALITIFVQKSIFDIEIVKCWNNITEINSTIGTTSGTFTYNVDSSISQYFSIEVFTQDVFGYWTKMRIDYLYFAKNTTYLQLANLTSVYYQYSDFYLNTTLSQIDGEIDENRAISIYNPSGTLIESETNELTTTIPTTCGFYTINVTYAGSDQFLGISIETLFEVIPANPPSLSISYSSIIYSNQTQNVSIYAISTLYSIDSIQFYDSISDSIQNLPIQTQQNVSLREEVSQSYSFSVKITDIHGFYTNIAVNNCYILKNESQFHLTNLYQQYYQNSTANISTTLSRDVNLSIYYPNGTLFNSEMNRIEVGFQFNTTGYYSIVAEYNDTTGMYCNYSISTVFEVMPLSRAIELSQDISLTVNGTAIIDNSVNLSYLSNEFSLNFTADSITTFDLMCYFLLNYTENITFEDNSLANFTFDSNSQISEIFILNTTIENYPEFDQFYYNGFACWNYTVFDTILQINEPINTTMLNLDKFEFLFSLFADELYQMDSSISTQDSSIHFRQFAIANRTFRNWYIGSEYSVESIEILHIRTGNVESIINSSNNYYFTEWLNYANDSYQIDWYLNPNWDIQYEILENNGTYLSIRVIVNADFDMENVTVYVNPADLYYSNWDNASQSIETNLVHFNTSRISEGINTFYLEATRDVPICDFRMFSSGVENYLTPDFNSQVPYYGVLQFDDYSEVWEIPIRDDWTLDGVHYGSNTYTIQNNVFFCEGFDSSISSVYLQFTANPVISFHTNVDLEQSIITLSIDLSLPLNMTIIMFYVKIDGNFKIKTRGISELYEDEGYTWYMIDEPLDLNDGTTTITIEFEVYSLSKSWYYALPILVVLGIGIAYWFRKKKEEQSGVK